MGEKVCVRWSDWWEVGTVSWLIEGGQVPIQGSSECLADWLTDGGAGAGGDGELTIFYKIQT